MNAIRDLVIKLDDLYLCQVYDERVEPTPHQGEASRFHDGDGEARAVWRRKVTAAIRSAVADLRPN